MHFEIVTIVTKMKCITQFTSSLVGTLNDSSWHYFIGFVLLFVFACHIPSRHIVGHRQKVTPPPGIASYRNFGRGPSRIELK